MKFQFRPVLTLWTLIGLAILVSLGIWQLQRSAWKTALLEKIELRMASAPAQLEDALALHAQEQDVDFLPVTVTGTAQANGEVSVFGTLDGEPGYYLFAPIMLATSEAVYVNRGFVPQGKERLPEMAAPETLTEAKGILRAYRPLPAIARMVAPAPDLEKKIWYQRDPQGFAEAAGFATPAFWVDLETPEGALPRQGETLLNIHNRHLQYALTWFGLALTLAGVYGAFSMGSRRDEKAEKNFPSPGKPE